MYVLDDGGEVDLDLGNYERYLNISLSHEHNITTGKIYLHVIERERRGDYLGKTVQIVPHLTDAIQDWIERVAKIPVDESGQEPDVCIVEVIFSLETSVFLTNFRHLTSFFFLVNHSSEARSETWSQVSFLRPCVSYRDEPEREISCRSMFLTFP